MALEHRFWFIQQKQILTFVNEIEVGMKRILIPNQFIPRRQNSSIQWVHAMFGC